MESDRAHGGGVFGIVLAGGRGARVGGADKGLLPLRGRPLIEHVLDLLRPQCDAILIVANRNRDAFSRYAPTIGDEIEGYAGPLAGIAAALRDVEMRVPPSGRKPGFDFMLTAPVDCPRPPRDLAARLRNELQVVPEAPCAFAHDGSGPQPLFALYRLRVLEELSISVRAALRTHASPVRWHGEIGAVVVDFADRASAFGNLNTPDDFNAYEHRHGNG